jgi:iron-sulfur cluster repair protein YtfE (RIC family)
MDTPSNHTEQQIDPTMTLGEIVTLKPSLAAELQRRGFDFCCHGDRSLADAAAELDLDAQNVAAHLSSIHQDEAPARVGLPRSDRSDRSH